MYSTSAVSPQWAIRTRAGSTPSCSKISSCRGPVSLAGREWAMIGLPVCRLARAAARWTFSMFSVSPGSSAAHLMNAALPRCPGSRSRCRRRTARRSDRDRARRRRRQVVVGVDAGGGDHQPGPLGDIAHEGGVAADEHHGRVGDRPHAEFERGPRRLERRIAVLPGRSGAPGCRRTSPRRATARTPPRRESAGAHGSGSPSSEASSGPVTVSTVAIGRQSMPPPGHQSLTTAITIEAISRRSGSPSDQLRGIVPGARGARG